MTSAADLRTIEAFADRLVEDVTRTLETLSVYLGIELGLYQSLDALGAATPPELAGGSGIGRRYAREWLEQQAAAGVLECVENPADGDQRRYRLPRAHGEVLLDPDGTTYLAPAVVSLAGVADVLPQLLHAYRTGGGVPFSAYGPAMRRGIAELNAPMFRSELATTWIPAIPGLDARLRSTPRPRVLDIGSGCGASTVAIGLAYPHVQVVGIDLDPASVEEARAAAATAGVADRVTFVLGDAATSALGGPFDLVTMFETLHDIAEPIAALRAARAALAVGASMLLADERVADQFRAPAEPVERFMYGWSVLHCLPATLAESCTDASGTVLRAPTIQRWAREAGFSSCEVLPIANPFWRFYRLHDH
jgi:2-polyprenyl-3-methyl-5-hydroxy-6-metoxy-1,4-benzoquinol methylase